MNRLVDWIKALFAGVKKGGEVVADINDAVDEGKRLHDSAMEALGYEKESKEAIDKAKELIDKSK